MKKKWTALLAAALTATMLWGCEQDAALPETVPTTETQPEETVPATVPQDGNPDDVTCKGSYTSQTPDSSPVASVGDVVLTNEQLQVYYWAEAARYRQSGQEPAPDFDKPLDTQACEIDTGVNSWQQYFLKNALNTWHSAQALKLRGLAEGLEPEEAYQPVLRNHEKYLVDIPAMVYHYSYDLETFHPNTMHQAYLDAIPETLDALAQEKGYANGAELADRAFGASVGALESAVELYNWSYMYFTELGYSLENTGEEVQAYLAEHGASGETGKYVTFRQILLPPEDLTNEDEIPVWKRDEVEPVVLETVEIAADGTVSCSEEAWEAGYRDAEAMLKKWSSNWQRTEGTFAELARYNSADPGTALIGGLYRNVRKGQMLDVVDQWCFAEERQVGDTTVLRSPYGYHILYFSGSRDISEAKAEEALTLEKQHALISDAREQYPMEVRYQAISLTEGEGTVSYTDVLYPDVSHERYPEAPLYLQQDYPKTMYGGYEIRTNGCGITTMSMLTTYMTDEEYTPPEMCAMYGRYSFSNGTDGRIFVLEPPVLGFFCKEKTYDPNVAKQALADGYMVVSLQHKGYWTRGGHYLLVEKMHEDGTVQVRDSNIFNYGKLDGHYVDSFRWGLLPANGSAFWIFENKVTAIPACNRCGQPEGVMEHLLTEDYTCEKCEKALLRRDTYLNACGQ